MNVVEETISTTSSEVISSKDFAVEFRTSNGESSVDSLNGVSVSSVKESGSTISVSFEIPADESAPAFVYSLMLGANLDTIYTHRSNSDGVVALTIKHDIQMVRDWSISSSKSSSSSQTIEVLFLTESSVVINGDMSIEEASSGSSN